MIEIGATQPSKRESIGRWCSLWAYYVRSEILKLFRMPMFSLPTLLFPIAFFAMFGMPFKNVQQLGINNGVFMMESFGTYAVMSVAMSSFSASIAVERGTGWNQLLKTTPMRTWTFFSGKIAMALFFELITLVAFLMFGDVVGHIHMAFSSWCQLTGLLLIGLFPFVTLGFFLGYVSGPTSATIVANLIFLPLSFASGLFIPLQMLPKFIQQVAPYLPSYNVAELGWTALGAHTDRSIWTNLGWITIYTIAFLAMSILVYRRDQGQKFG